VKRYLPLLILTVGLGLAAASAARHGTEHEAWRAAVWQAGEDGTEVPPPPEPSARLFGWFSRAGVGWGLGVGIVLVGAVLARRQQAADNAAGGAGGAAVDFVATLDVIDVELAALSEELADLPMDQTADAQRERIDHLLEVVIGDLVDGRGVLMARHGIASFAMYFGPFSSGERQLARVWSALTDGHAVVAREALVQSQQSFRQARAAWEEAG
jgi:hypothetical protein